MSQKKLSAVIWTSWKKEGLATKSYGGAVINEDVGIDLPFNVRKNQNVQGKQKMAEIAASMVNDGDHIFSGCQHNGSFLWPRR